MRRTRSYAAVVALTVVAAAAGTAAAMTASASAGGNPNNQVTGCRLGAPSAPVKHVIYLQFDNVHFTRDNPNVPSDLEQMPNLLNFLESNGTVDTNHHTPLIAHTANDILTSLTGVYGDKHGQPIANSYKYYTPAGTANTGVSFAYWTDGVFDPSTATPTDTAPTMVAQNGKTAPAPWVAYTRAGCDFGAVATANTILENIGPDVPKVFGAGSPEAAEAAAAKTNNNLATTDFVGIGVHCAQGSKICAAAGADAKSDVLPDEPGGYTGFQGVFGAKYTNPVISPSGPVLDVSGTNPIADSLGRPGFPGFDGMSAANSLGYVAQMQEAGIPVTYGYISDAHDNHAGGGAFGPGQAGYVAQLKAYDTAFGQFFQRLANDGINASNTDLVITSDENDHFAGGAPSPSNCDGVTVPCTYTKVGEVNTNIRGLLATQAGDTTPFVVHSDSAPNYYLTGNPAAASAPVRGFEHNVAGLTATNPITGNTETFANYFADPVEMKLLHMVTADPLRTPTFTEFANPDYFVFAGAPNCTSPCVTENPAFAWNHGDFSPDINTTWVGFTGPSFQQLGVTNSVWSDHTDIRPTMLAALGLRDDYVHDGVPLVQFLQPNVLAPGLHGQKIADLEAIYKQLDACVGAFGADTLKASTKGIESATANDQQYSDTEAALTALGAARDALAAKIAADLDGAAFHHGGLDADRVHDLVGQAQALLDQAHTLAG